MESQEFIILPKMATDSNRTLVNSEGLIRNIGPLGLALAVVNMTVGTGIFVLPALVAEKLGSGAIICFFICGFLIFLIALCFAELGSKISLSGGAYTYIELAFGPFAGFLANGIYLASCLFSDAAVASAITQTIAFFFPIVATPMLPPIIYIILFGGLAWINIRGATYGLSFVVFSTVAKLFPLLAIIGLGLFKIKAGNLAWNHSMALHDISSSTLILFFAFFGVETAIMNGGEFKNPARTVPLGVIGGLSIVLILYISIQVVSQGVLGKHLQSFKDAPLVAVSQILYGPIGITLMTIGTLLSMLGSLSGSILANPRCLYAGARDGLLPKILFKVHPKYNTPHLSILFYVTIGFVLAVFGIFKELIILSSALTLLIYLGVALATMKMSIQNPQESRKSFKMPGGITIPVLAILMILWVLQSLSKTEILGMAIFIAGFSALFLLYRSLPKDFVKRVSKSA